MYPGGAVLVIEKGRSDQLSADRAAFLFFMGDTVRKRISEPLSSRSWTRYGEDIVGAVLLCMSCGGVFTMKSRLSLKPGRKGTKKLVEQYGTSLLYVRYRYDEVRGVRLKSV
jgi:hypothetical protein